MNTVDLRSIGNNLLTLRTKEGYTQWEVAELAGISDRTYADIERGKVNMRIGTLLNICQALKTSPEEVFSTLEKRSAENLYSQSAKKKGMKISSGVAEDILFYQTEDYYKNYSYLARNDITTENEFSCPCILGKKPMDSFSQEELSEILSKCTPHVRNTALKLLSVYLLSFCPVLKEKERNREKCRETSDCHRKGI